eukprot:5048918-Ditylum_brightwellii.AAC.1
MLKSRSIDQDAVNVARRRMKDFSCGKPFAFHRIESDHQAQDVVRSAEKQLADTSEKISCLDKEIQSLKTKRTNEVSDKMELACIHPPKIYDYGRALAKAEKLERPWDGTDGADFINFLSECASRKKSCRFIKKDYILRNLDNLVMKTAYEWDCIATKNM